MRGRSFRDGTMASPERLPIWELTSWGRNFLNMDLARNGEPVDPVPERKTVMKPSIPSRITSQRGEWRARIRREGAERQREDP
jgi:hypothetical protein